MIRIARELARWSGAVTFMGWLAKTCPLCAFATAAESGYR